MADSAPAAMFLPRMAALMITGSKLTDIWGREVSLTRVSPSRGPER